ncbi:response regulator [Chryseolinea lacunae]|uniref:Response regulator n=1 Tax=Chryseolinea lacunae TaxID=2801331 RepID=A0ABS1KUK0_9BACT|nr:response regulator [Chryseolinea lacunae]MBL0743163.1 response regulator [Chryseolinea lacunae]
MESLSILLVEDDPDDVELMRDALLEKDIAFNLDVVKQGDAVIPFLKSCKKFPNVILLDLNLPKLHGREVLVKLKEDADLKHIPVVILTTSSAQSEKEYCLEAGATEFLTKPTTVEGFASCIASILEIAGVKI